MKVRFVGLAVGLLLTLAVAVPAVQAQEKPFKGVDLYVALRSLPETDFIMAHVGEFEAATGADVHFVLYPELLLREKITLDLVTGTGAYDVIAVDNMYIPEYAEKGWIVPFTIPEETIEDLLPVYRETNMYKGELYALPIYGETTQLMYNKELFEKEGVAPPKTMEELEEVAKHFTRPPKIYGIALRGLRGEGMNVYIWTGFLRAFGGRFFTKEDDTGFPIEYEPAFNSPEAIQATEFYARLIQKYSPPGGCTFSWDDVQTVFAAGKVAMIIDATNFLTRIEDPAKSAIAGKIGYAELPAGPAGRFPSIYTLGFAISAVGAKTDLEREAAAAFIRWATSRSMELDKALQAGIVSVTRRSVFEDPAFIAKNAGYPGWRESTVKGLEEALPNYRPRFIAWREMGDIIGIKIEEVFCGLKDAKTALDEAVAEVREILVEAGLLEK